MHKGSMNNKKKKEGDEVTKVKNFNTSERLGISKRRANFVCYM